MSLAFISYAQADEATARRLREELNRRGISVASMDSLVAPGESWAARLQSAIAESDLFLAVLSRESERSQAVAAETAMALSQAERGQTRVVPVIVDRRAEMPFFLRRIQALDFSNPEKAQRQLDELASAVKSGNVVSGDMVFRADAELRYLEASKRALTLEVANHASKMAERSSRIAAAVMAAGTVAVALSVFAGLVRALGKDSVVIRWLALDAANSEVIRWLVPFGLGVLLSVLTVVLAAWFRRRIWPPSWEAGRR